MLIWIDAIYTFLIMPIFYLHQRYLYFLAYHLKTNDPIITPVHTDKKINPNAERACKKDYVKIESNRLKTAKAKFALIIIQ